MRLFVGRVPRRLRVFASKVFPSRMSSRLVLKGLTDGKSLRATRTAERWGNGGSLMGGERGVDCLELIDPKGKQ